MTDHITSAPQPLNPSTGLPLVERKSQLLRHECPHRPYQPFQPLYARTEERHIVRITHIECEAQFVLYKMVKRIQIEIGEQ